MPVELRLIAPGKNMIRVELYLTVQDGKKGFSANKTIEMPFAPVVGMNIWFNSIEENPIFRIEKVNYILPENMYFVTQNLVLDNEDLACGYDARRVVEDFLSVGFVEGEEINIEKRRLLLVHANNGKVV